MLSSATLFHFTNSIENLKAILGGGFKPFYAREDLKMFHLPCTGIPMVSFCDIPLSQTREHIGTYGRYAVGCHKEWGMSKKNISPVHYIWENSVCAKVVHDIYRSLPASDDTGRCKCLTFSSQTAIFFFVKPYAGKVADRASEATKPMQPKKFYDEREWRYLPFADQTLNLEQIPDGVRHVLSEAEYDDINVRRAATKSLHMHYRLKFRAEDVRYLIVNSESEIPETVDFIRDPSPEYRADNDVLKCTEDDTKRLTTRVISMNQIEEDF